MKKLFFALIAGSLLITSCIDPSLPNLDGMWQLKTFEDAEGKQLIDTIFYSFQYQRSFSVTILNADYTIDWHLNDPTAVIYGFTDFSAENQMTLDIHTPWNLYAISWHEEDWWKFIPWATPDKEKSFATLTICKHTSKQLILRHEDTGTTYSFTKF